MVRISKNQKKILEILAIKPDMTTKEIAEMVFGKLIEYKTKEYSSIHRSLISLEKQGLIKRVQVKINEKVGNLNDELKQETDEKRREELTKRQGNLNTYLDKITTQIDNLEKGIKIQQPWQTTQTQGQNLPPGTVLGPDGQLVSSI